MQPVRVSWLPRSIFTCLLFLCDKSQSFLKTKPLITVHKVPQTQTTTLKLHLWLSCWCLWTPFVIDWTPLSFYQHTLSLSLMLRHFPTGARVFVGALNGLKRLRKQGLCLSRCHCSLNLCKSLP